MTNLKLGENAPLCSKSEKCLWNEIKALAAMRCTYQQGLAQQTLPDTRQGSCAKTTCSNGRRRPGTWKSSAPSSKAAQVYSRISPWLTAGWQHAVKHGGQMEALTKWRTTPVHHADKFQGYYPFISTTVYGQQLTWQSMPMRVSRDTWKSFILHSNELMLPGCRLLAAS